MPEAKHARFSPSKLPRIIACPGSAQLCEEIEHELGSSTESSYAQEGTYLHSITEDHLTRDAYAVETILDKDPDVHAEYKSAVETILDFAFGLRVQLKDYEDYVEYIEARVSCAGFEEFAKCDLLNEVEGTVDWMIKSNRTLYIIDWKFGKGVVVSPTSAQLLGYAAGGLKNPEFARNFDRVVCIIGQPRVGDDFFNSVTYTVEEVLRWVKHELSPALQETKARPPILRPSVEACRWCAVGVSCKARHSMALSLAESAFKIYAELPDRVSVSALSEFLDLAPNLDQYIKDLTNFAFETIQKGGIFPGYKVVRGRANRVWVNEETAKIALEERGYDVSELSEVKFWGPAKVEKVLKKADKKDESFLPALITKPEGKLTLAKEDDAREAVSFKTAEQIFADYVE